MPWNLIVDLRQKLLGQELMTAIPELEERFRGHDGSNRSIVRSNPAWYYNSTIQWTTLNKN